jgi:hypothetical protein
MRKGSGVLLLLLALGGCAGVPAVRQDDPCVVQGEASAACQVKRYHDVAA